MTPPHDVRVPDPTPLYRVRDGVYAADLLIAAVAEFDLFSRLAAVGPVPAAAAARRARAWPSARPTCC